jgi:hypothetical protein
VSAVNKKASVIAIWGVLGLHTGPNCSLFLDGFWGCTRSPIAVFFWGGVGGLGIVHRPKLQSLFLGGFGVAYGPKLQ